MTGIKTLMINTVNLDKEVGQIMMILNTETIGIGRKNILEIIQEKFLEEIAQFSSQKRLQDYGMQS